VPIGCANCLSLFVVHSGTPRLFEQMRNCILFCFGHRDLGQQLVTAPFPLRPALVTVLLKVVNPQGLVMLNPQGLELFDGAGNVCLFRAGVAIQFIKLRTQVLRIHPGKAILSVGF